MKNWGVKFVLGAGVFFAVVLFVVLWSGGLPMFINIPSFLFVAGVAGGLGLAAYKGGGFLGYVEACRKHFISAGVLGTVTGVILMLQALEDPSQIGRGMAVALLTIFYGLVFYCVADALLANTKNPDIQA
jgi:flagellar motor component MotA